MKKEFTKADLKPDMLSELEKHLKKPDLTDNMCNILRVVADCLDSAIKGSNSYVTFGVTRDKKAVILTVNYEGTKIYASGETLWEIADKCKEML